MGAENRTKENGETQNVDIDEIEILHEKDIENRNNEQIEEGIVVMESHFSGPLPSPDTLAGYERIHKGAADRIIKMAENQMQHRHQMETNFLGSHSRNSLLGIIAAFILGLILSAGGVICVLKDKELSGILLGGTGIVAIVTTFIQGTKMSANNGQVNKNNNPIEE